MKQGNEDKWVKHGTGVRYLRPTDRYKLYTDIDLEYHLHVSDWRLN